MGLRDFLKSLINRGDKVKQIADPINTVETGDGDKEDLTSRAYYKSRVRQNRADIVRLTGYVEQYTAKFEQVKQQFPEGSKEYIEAKDEMYRWIVRLDEIKSQEEFYRPNTKEDIAYRDKIMESFPEQLKTALSPNLDLRFHSTPINFAKQIIESRQISSTPDRYDGYTKNSDGLGEISASSRDDIVRTIRHYSRLQDYTDCLPAGCVFALFPKDKKDAENKDRSVMGSVDFKKNPEQLFGVLTTPENIEMVKEWMEKAELNPDLVYTHEAFLEAVKVKSGIEDRKAEFENRIAQSNVKGAPTKDWMSNEDNLIIVDPDLYQDIDDDYSK